jgi:hypothetical protein
VHVDVPLCREQDTTYQLHPNIACGTFVFLTVYSLPHALHPRIHRINPSPLSRYYAEVHNDGLGSSFRREVAQLDRLLSETEGPPDGLGKISESDSSLSGQPSVSVSGVSSPDSRPGGSPKLNSLEMASLAREYRLDAKPALMSVGVKTGSGAKPGAVKPGSDPTDKDVPEESWISANRKEPEGWSSMRKDQTAEDARAFAELMNRGWEGLGTEGTRLRDGWPLFRVSAVVCQTLGVIYIVWRACRTYNIEALWLSIPFYMAELVSFLPSFIFCLEASRIALLRFPVFLPSSSISLTC